MSISQSRRVTLVTSSTTTIAAPATINDETLGQPLPWVCDQATIHVYSTAGSGTMTVTVRLWGYQVELDRWFDLGPLNAGNAIPETSKADTISYAEGVMGLRTFDRVYAEISAIAGTLTAVSIELICIRQNAVMGA